MDAGLMVGNHYYPVGDPGLLEALETAVRERLDPDAAPTLFRTLGQRPLAPAEATTALAELEQVRAALEAEPAPGEPVRGGSPAEAEFDEGPPASLADAFLTRDGRRLLPLLERALRYASEEGLDLELLRG